MFRPLVTIFIVALFSVLFGFQEAAKVWQNFNQDGITMDLEGSEESEDPCEDDEADEGKTELFLSKYSDLRYHSGLNSQMALTCHNTKVAEGFRDIIVRPPKG